MVKRGKKFFKVYLPGQSTQQLRIPPAFIKEFNGTIPSKSTIMNHGRRQWRVEMNMVGNNLYFQNGWHKFVGDNTLEYGDFLVFSYFGSSKFYVKIFGKSGCLKEVPIPTGKTTQKALTVFQENQTFKPRKSEERGKQIAIEENDGARKAATKFDSAYPFFQIVIKPSYSAEIKGCFLNIPFRFFKEYMEKGKENAVLHVSTKSWPVKVKIYQNRQARFSMGWAAFAKDNTLKAGDVCVFELIKRDDFVLKVSIVRG